MLTLSTNDITLLNEVFRSLDCFHESFNLLNFFIQPHVIHVNKASQAMSTSPVSKDKLHMHRTFECSIVIEGATSYKFVDREIEIKAGDAIIIPAELAHCWRANQDSIIFSLMLFISCHGEKSRENMLNFKQTLAKMKYSIKNFSEMKYCFEVILKEAQTQRAGFDEKIKCLTQEIYIEIFRKILPMHRTAQRSLRMPPKRGNISTSVVELIRFYVQDNISNVIKLENISSSLGISVSHLSRIFKKNHGEPIHKYIINTRIKRACSLLENTDRPLKDIATTTGFEDIGYFCRVFKKHKGMTPSQFRKNL